MVSRVNKITLQQGSVGKPRLLLGLKAKQETFALTNPAMILLFRLFPHLEKN